MYLSGTQRIQITHLLFSHDLEKKTFLKVTTYLPVMERNESFCLKTYHITCSINRVNETKRNCFNPWEGEFLPILVCWHSFKIFYVNRNNNYITLYRMYSSTKISKKCIIPILHIIKGIFLFFRVLMKSMGKSWPDLLIHIYTQLKLKNS